MPQTVVESMARDWANGREPTEHDLKVTRWWLRRVARGLADVLTEVSTEVPRVDRQSESNFVPDEAKGVGP